MAEPLAREVKPLVDVAAWMLFVILVGGFADLFGWADPSDGWFWGFGSATLIVFTKAVLLQNRRNETRRWTREG